MLMVPSLVIRNYLAEGKDNGCKAKARCGVGSQVRHVGSFRLDKGFGGGGNSAKERRDVFSCLKRGCKRKKTAKRV